METEAEIKSTRHKWHCFYEAILLQSVLAEIGPRIVQDFANRGPCQGDFSNHFTGTNLNATDWIYFWLAFRERKDFHLGRVD